MRWTSVHDFIVPTHEGSHSAWLPWDTFTFMFHYQQFHNWLKKLFHTHGCFKIHGIPRPSLIQIMSCCLTSAKPLSELMLEIVNWTLGIKFHWNFNQYTTIFIQQNACENVICKVPSISSWCQCVKLHVWLNLIRYKAGGRLNKKDGLTRYGNSHVKDKTS